MANLTDGENHTLSCTTGLYEKHQKIFISISNIPLSVTAFLGNVLIIVALQKASSLHPPSKLLYRCLTFTDLFVGLITQPLYSIYLMSPENSKRCYYVRVLFNTMGAMFGEVSFLTLTTISVDRLLALLLGLRYRQVVTLRRVKVAVCVFWLSSAASRMVFLHSLRFSTGSVCLVLLLCVITSTFCYTKIYLKLRHQQAQVEDHSHQEQANGEGITLNIARYRKTVS